jgi:hypothetical protein
MSLTPRNLIAVQIRRSEALVSDDASPDEPIDLDEALARLSSVDAGAAEVVKLRPFAGPSLDDAASAMGVFRRSAQRAGLSLERFRRQRPMRQNSGRRQAPQAGQ